MQPASHVNLYRQITHKQSVLEPKHENFEVKRPSKNVFHTYNLQDETFSSHSINFSVPRFNTIKVTSIVLPAGSNFCGDTLRRLRFDNLIYALC